MPLCFNAPCQFTPLHDLYSHICNLTPFGWLCVLVRLTLISGGNIIFDLCLSELCPLFQECNQGVKQGLGVFVQTQTRWNNGKYQRLCDL